jgi:hypothetical protein
MLTTCVQISSSWYVMLYLRLGVQEKRWLSDGQAYCCACYFFNYLGKSTLFTATTK